MKICWDNLERVRLSSYGNLIINNDIYVEVETCESCGDSFLSPSRVPLSRFCSKSCGKVGKFKSDITKRRISETRIREGTAKGTNNPMYGKKFSKEHLEKMSVALKGKYSGANAYWYGKNIPEEVKEKIKNTKTGTCFGKDNTNWRGGISCEPYCQDWTKEYKEYIKERDGYKCLNPYCSNNCNVLSVHHIDYNKKNCSHNNLITVCRACNTKANYDRDWHEAWYKAIITKRYKYNSGEK